MHLKTFKTGFLLMIGISLLAQNKEIFKQVEFESENATLRGRLYTPNSHSQKHPIIIMGHGFSCTIEGMVADRYAEVFRDAGYAVLLYDHRNLGISDGEPRQQLNRWTQARGFRDAVDFVITLPEVDTTKIGLWGDSMSGDEVIAVAAMDYRVKLVIAQVPACGREFPPEDPDGSHFRSMKQTFLFGNVEATPETTLGPMPIVSFDQETFTSLLKPLTAYRWFIEYGGRFNTKWVNRATYVNPNVSTKFTSVYCAPYIKAALLMLIAHDDEMPGANTKVSRYAYEIAPQPKKLIEIDGGHFGIVHYPSPLFDLSSKAQIDFLKEYFD
ncbi:MAG: alpha/beta hydrolase [Bacteroidota bacterium]